MEISATVINREGQHSTVVRTGDSEQHLPIAAKAEGSGSAVNGGELLFLALATCYCNDLYREAKRLGVPVTSVRVEVSGQFAGIGAPANDIRYRAAVASTASDEDVLALMRHTDAVAEIHNTLRQATPVVLTECQVLGGDGQRSTAAG